MDQVANMCVQHEHVLYVHNYVKSIPHFQRKFYREWNRVHSTGFTSFTLHPNRSMRERCTSHVNNCDRNRKWIPLEYQLSSWLASRFECNGSVQWHLDEYVPVIEQPAIRVTNGRYSLWYLSNYCEPSSLHRCSSHWNVAPPTQQELCT